MRDVARDQTDGSYFCRVSALLFMSFSVEGFVNDLLMRTRPATWNRAREFFRQGEHRGTSGKLRYLLDEFDVSYVRGARPFQTVVALLKRRHLFVHPTTEKQSGELRIQTGQQAPPPSNKLARIAEPAFLARAHHDVELLCDKLQSAAYEKEGHPVVTSALAFNGPMGWLARWS